jgi:hypothetical protein
MATAAWSRSGSDLPEAAGEAAVAKLGYLPPQDFAALILQNRCSRTAATASWWALLPTEFAVFGGKSRGRLDALSRVSAE